ncbi:hypothetical protein KP509_07G009100 [Ceratopteris richardii]|nr:hypothetical protein KP509_07G009100 [Ceratopteris richardii]
MCYEGIFPERLTIVSIISSATSNGALAEGKLAHSYAAEVAFINDVFVGTALINMHGKCGSPLDSRSMFNSLQNLDTIAWNAMIDAYAHNEEYKMSALQIFKQMLQEGVKIDSGTLVNILAACSTDLDLSEGKYLHILANELKLDGELLVVTAMLTMYSKCSNIKHVRKLFDRIHKHDTVSWNTMIGAYASDGQIIEALHLFQQMHKEGVKPDKISFLSILEAFSGEQALTEGKKMHRRISQSGYELDIVVGTALINMYGRCGSPEDAWIMFDKMPMRNAYTWNSMIAAYAQNAQGLRAIQVLKNMQAEGLKPDRFTLLSIVNSSATISEIEDVHFCIASSLSDSDDVSGSALIYLYGKCGSLTMAWLVFNRYLQDSLVLWNSMVAALARNGESKKASQLYKQMLLQGLLPDKSSYLSIIDAFEDEETLLPGKQMHACIIGANIESDIAIVTALLNMYIRCSSLEEALSLFESVDTQDVISWTSLITACCQLEKYSEALQLFECMQKKGFQPDKVTFVCILSVCTSPADLTQGKYLHTLIVQSEQDSNVVLGNAILNMYCRCGSVEDALSVFKRIQFCDSVTYISVLSACANCSLLFEGEKIHSKIKGTEYERDIIIGNALIGFYGKCGSLTNAQLTFDKMECRDTVTWTALVAAYAQQGHGNAALLMFERMLHEGNKPNEITFVNVLSACCHDGLIYEACHYFYYMKFGYGVLPLVHHYDCLVDLFARAGRLDEAENLISGMPFPATAVSWTTLLSACKGLADIQRGIWAAGQAFDLDPENYSPFLILRTIYGASDSVEGFKDIQQEEIGLLS